MHMHSKLGMGTTLTCTRWAENQLKNKYVLPDNTSPREKTKQKNNKGCFSALRLLNLTLYYT